MKCPYCKQNDDRVIDSRASGDGFVIRRRRECLACSKRFSTYERIEESVLRIIKKDGTRANFDRKKILSGFLKACEKRPVSIERLEELTTRIEAHLLNNYDREVKSTVIGELVMEELRNLDQVAYVRFASVYREFEDITEFVDELKPLLDKHKKAKKQKSKT